MNYVYIDNDRKVKEIVPAEDPRFPEVPIQKRYDKAFLDRCLEVSESVEVNQGDEYLPVQNVFVTPLMSQTPGEVITEGEPESITVSFSEEGTWELVSTDLDVQVDGDTITIPADVTGTITIRFTETQWGRTQEQTIQVRPHVVPEEQEPELEEPDDSFTEAFNVAIEKGLTV